MSISHVDFMNLLGAEFPEAAAAIGRRRSGSLHLDMAGFRRNVEEAIDGGRLWIAEKSFRFIDRMLDEADPDLRNAIEVSFLEDFALGEFTRARHEAVRSRMPRRLREILVRIDPKWR